MALRTETDVLGGETLKGNTMITLLTLCIVGYACYLIGKSKT